MNLSEILKASVQELDIFVGIDLYSLACSKVAPVLEKASFSRMPTKLEHLRLNLSHDMVEDVEDRNDKASKLGIAARTSHVNDIKSISGLRAGLESDEIYRYKLLISRLSVSQHEEQLFCNQIVHLCDHFSKLRHRRLDVSLPHSSPPSNRQHHLLD
jgi:hypothetical protein